MNQKIKNLDYSKLLFTDIETVAETEGFDENHPKYDIWAWKQRDKETDVIKTAEENIRLYYKKAPLLAEWGKIVCISVGFIHNEELYVKSFTGNESQILLDFVNMVKSTGRMLAGHNLIGYDVPFCRKRFIINNLGDYLSEKQGNDVYMKPWLLDDAIFDSMIAWKGSGFANTSLEELAMVFNIPTSKDEYHGNQITELYYGGKIEELKKYCEKDVTVVANIVRVWRGESILEPTIKVETETKKQPMLVKLYNSKQFNQEVKDELKSLKILKRDKPTVIKLVLAHYMEQIDVMSRDKKELQETNKKREEEVIEFFKTL